MYKQDYSIQQSYHLELKAEKVLPGQGKTKGVYHHQAIITWNVKGNDLRKGSKLWTLKWQKTHSYQQLNLKSKNKLSKQLEQE